MRVDSGRKKWKFTGLKCTAADYVEICGETVWREGCWLKSPICVWKSDRKNLLQETRWARQSTPAYCSNLLSTCFLQLFCLLAVWPSTPLSIMWSSSDTELKRDRNTAFTFAPFRYEKQEESCVSGQGNPSKNTAPLGRPGGEIRQKLPVRKREDFSQSLFPSLSRQTSWLKATFMPCYMLFTITYLHY